MSSRSVFCPLDRKGFRPLEIVIGALITVIGLSYLCELVIAPPNWHAAIFHTFVPHLHGNDALMLAVGIVGATIMPHTIYLHSGLTQNRAPTRDDYQRRRLVRFSNCEVVIALGFACFVNLAMVAMSASVFSQEGAGYLGHHGGISHAYACPWCRRRQPRCSSSRCWRPVSRVRW